MMRVLTGDKVDAVLRKGGPASRLSGKPARFQPGDRVRVRNLNPPTHTRAPRYLRLKRGVIERDHGIFVFPDTNALELGETPQHLYSVRFESREVWGEEGAAGNTILADLWDDYLEPA
ncbi:MAG TPA: SH3-like domain-containing protein [Kiloniellales bacterium]|nr:SH3-like domain-containing protein [Kiloniellales bacterium]